MKKSPWGDTETLRHIDNMLTSKREELYEDRMPVGSKVLADLAIIAKPSYKQEVVTLTASEWARVTGPQMSVFSPEEEYEAAEAFATAKRVIIFSALFTAGFIFCLNYFLE